MKNINPLAIGMAIVIVIVASYFLFGFANFVTILAIIAALVVVMTVPTTSVRDQNRVVSTTKRTKR